MSTKPASPKAPARLDSVDPRAARVRDSLRQAAFELIEQRRVERISVSDITQRAHVSRQVFYQHFRDRDDAVATAVVSAFRDTSAEQADDEPLTLIHRLCDYAADHAEVYRNLYPSAASQQATNAYRDLLLPGCTTLASTLLTERGREPDDATVDPLAVFLLGGVMEVIRQCVEVPSPKRSPTAGYLRARVDACLVAVLARPR